MHFQTMGDRVRLAAMGALVAVSSSASLAHAGVIDDLLGTTEKNWKEVVPALPAVPADADLVSFYVSPLTRFRFAVDTHSITIGKDGVVHYTLVATSANGVRNVSFEGMRCDSKEHKVYAWGRADGTWIHPRSDAWQPVGEGDRANRQDAALYKDVICTDGMPLNVRQVIRRLEVNPYKSLPY